MRESSRVEIGKGRHNISLRLRIKEKIGITFLTEPILKKIIQAGNCGDICCHREIGSTRL